MILSDKDLKKRIVKDETAISLWEKGEWDKIKDSILIYPFKETRLGANSYDISVGQEYVSLRDPHNVKKLEQDKTIEIAPGETVLILTQEYIALPKNIVAMVVPRARWIFEGIALNATKVDATWYGKLLVGFTNLAKYPIFLRLGEAFCTCYFMECSEIEQVLTEKEVPFIGRKTIDPLHFEHAKPLILLTPDEVTRKHLEDVVKSFGYPFDVVRGSIERSKEEIEQYVEKEVAPHIIEHVSLIVKERAYNDLLKWFKILITIFGTVVLVPIVLWALRFLGIV